MAVYTIRYSRCSTLVLVFLFLAFIVDAFHGSKFVNRQSAKGTRRVAHQDELPVRKTTTSTRQNFTAKKNTQQNSSNNNGRLNGSKQLNQMLVQCQDATELLELLQHTPNALTKKASGGALNKVNFSTSLHRLARHSLQQSRTVILSDARFALLLASLAEAWTELEFSTREASNIGWAIAKLKIAPPQSVVPWSDPSSETLLDVAKRVRQAVLASRTDGRKTWIPDMSQLAGLLLDGIGSRILKQKAADFQLQEYANLLWAWATAQRANPDTFQRMIKDMMRSQARALQKSNGSSLRPQEWSNSIWAFATAQVYQSHDELIEFVAQLMVDYPNFVESYKTQELSNTVWGIATLLANQRTSITSSQEKAALTILRSITKALIERAHEFKSQELSNTAWALATLGFGLLPSADQAVNNYVVLKTDNHEGDRQLLQQALDAIVAAAKPKIQKFRSQELNNLAWALARVVSRKDESIEALLRDIGLQLCNRKRSVTSQDIGTTLWSMATLEFLDDDIYRQIAARLTAEHATSFKPQEISNTLWALATAEIKVEDKDAFDTSIVPQSARPHVEDPITTTFGIGARELMRRPEQFKSQEIKDVLWSFSKIGIRHPSLFKAVTEHLVGKEDVNQTEARGLQEFSPQGLGNMAWAFARQAQLAEEASNRLKNVSNIRSSNGRLAVYTASYFDVGEALIQRLFAAIAMANIENHNNLAYLKPQDLSNQAWTFAVLGLRHSAFVESAKSELASRVQRFLDGEVNSMTAFKGQEIANLLWALATLNVPIGDVLKSLVPYLRELCGHSRDQRTIPVKSIAKIFKRQEMANMAWACAVFGQYPTELMEFLYQGLVGSGQEQSTVYMAKVYDDAGLQSQAIMSLIYVQAALDREGSNQDNDILQLPPNFPDGWGQLMGNENIENDMIEVGIELTLSTSRIQRTVSAAFERIGFNHIEEHIITMEEMANDYGINVPPKQLEILSIDIANLEEKIGIEVDGPAHFINKIDHGLCAGGFTKVINGKLEYQFGWNGDRQEMNGPTALKQRLLQSLGWKVVHLPFWEWSAMNGDPQLEEEYCRNILTKIM